MSTNGNGIAEKMVFRQTHQHTGRRVSVTPANSTNQHLSYGRIILNQTNPEVTFSNGNQETGLICLSGSARVKGAKWDLSSLNMTPFTSLVTAESR